MLDSLTNAEGLTLSKIRLIQFTKDQVSEQWDKWLAEVVKVGLGLDDQESELCQKSVFVKLQRGVLKAYLIGAEGSDGKKYGVGVVIVYTANDSITQRKNLLIWSLYGVSHLEMDHWREVLKKLRLIKRELGCTSMIALTANPRVIELVQELGGKIGSTLVTLE